MEEDMAEKKRNRGIECRENKKKEKP